MIPGGPRDDPRRQRALREWSRAERSAERSGAAGSPTAEQERGADAADAPHRIRTFHLPQSRKDQSWKDQSVQVAPTMRSARSA